MYEYVHLYEIQLFTDIVHCKFQEFIWRYRGIDNCTPYKVADIKSLWEDETRDPLFSKYLWEIYHFCLVGILLRAGLELSQ